ncbi:MAG: cell division protein FtsH, partial [Robiginitomaculum sp.]
MPMRNMLLWGVIILVVIALFNMVQSTTSKNGAEVISYSTMMDQATAGRITKVTIRGESVFGKFNDNKFFSTTAPFDPQMVTELRKAGVNITVKPQDRGILFSIMMNFLPILLLVSVWIFFMRQMQGGGKGGAMGFGKSKARLLTERSGKITFADVAGVDEAKEELEEIVEFLQDPSKFQRLGGK